MNDYQHGSGEIWSRSGEIWSRKGHVSHCLDARSTDTSDHGRMRRSHQVEVEFDDHL